MPSMVESTTTPGTFVKSTNIPTSWVGKALNGLASLFKGEALAPEVAQPALIVAVGTCIVGGDALGHKAALRGDGPMYRLRKPL